MTCRLKAALVSLGGQRVALLKFGNIKQKFQKVSEIEAQDIDLRKRKAAVFIM